MKNVIILCFLFVSILANAQENIQWRGTDRSGVYNEKGLLESWPDNGPALNWHYEGLGEGHSSVAIDDDKLYVTGIKNEVGIIYVFDLDGKTNSAKRIWYRMV